MGGSSPRQRLETPIFYSQDIREAAFLIQQCHIALCDGQRIGLVGTTQQLNQLPFLPICVRHVLVTYP